MLKEENKDQASPGSWKKYSRSVSWTERPPRNSNNPKPIWNSKARASLPPLQPLSIIRPSTDEWPTAGSDDLGVWTNPPTPGVRSGPVTPRETSTSTSNQALPKFEFRKDKLAFFNKECSRILDHIYLGSDAIAKNRETLRKNGITHVLNCVGFVCPEYFKEELAYKTLWLQDSPSEDITSILYDVFDYFEDVREQGGRVLVHCCQGVSRSTSLVIAYLMWKEGQSFDDAFQLVKEARGITNPNVGFACQLLQCQKRVHAMPASPSSLLRMYRMAPHSPYDPLHLVPKMICEVGPGKLDSRGAFIVQIPSALYVWIGKLCSPVMSENAGAAASQIFRYESVKGPVLAVKEGEETFEFWDALSCRKSSADDFAGQRKLDEYDLDFEIFHRAVSGGVVPPFPLSGGGSEMCLPARENGWYRLRRKFSIGVVKDFITSAKMKSGAFSLCEEKISVNTHGEVEDVISSPDRLSSQCDSPDSFASYITSSPGCIETSTKEVEFSDSLSQPSLSRSPSFNLVDPFSSFLVSKPNSNPSSPSISPSTSDYSSSFTFSPSSSNWSDLSCVSVQPSSPYGVESRDTNPGNSRFLEERVGSGEDSTCLLDNATSLSQGETISTVIGKSSCSKGGDTFPSLAERRGNHPPPRMILPSIAEASQNSGKLTRYLGDGVMGDLNLSREVSFEMDGEDWIHDAISFDINDDASS